MFLHVLFYVHFIKLCNDYFQELKTQGGGYSHQNRTWMCLPDLKNLTFFIPFFFLLTFPTHQYTIFEKKNTPNLCNLGSFVSDEKPRGCYTKFPEKAPQNVGTYTFTMSMWDNPPPGWKHIVKPIRLWVRLWVSYSCQHFQSQYEKSLKSNHN